MRACVFLFIHRDISDIDMDMDLDIAATTQKAPLSVDCHVALPAAMSQGCRSDACVKGTFQPH